MASALHSPRVARLPRMLSAHWNGSVKPSFACARCAAKAAMTHTRLVAVVILIALALMPWGAPAAGRRDDDRRGAPVKKQQKPQTWRQAKPEDSDDDKGPWINGVSPKVRKHVGSGDRARVLVSLRLPGRGHVPESRLTHAAASLQRSDIALIGGQLMARLRKYNVRIVHRYTYVPLIALEIDAAALAELEGAALWVDRVFDDAIKQPILAESVPLIGADRAWGRGFDGSGTVVAVLDTGVDASHPFLLGKVVEEACYSSTLLKHSTTFCPNGLDEQVGPGAAVPCPLDAQGCLHGAQYAEHRVGQPEPRWRLVHRGVRCRAREDDHRHAALGRGRDRGRRR